MFSSFPFLLVLWRTLSIANLKHVDNLAFDIFLLQRLRIHCLALFLTDSSAQGLQKIVHLLFCWTLFDFFVLTIGSL